MRIQQACSALILGLLFWSGGLLTVAGTYHFGKDAGLIRNLHVRAHLGLSDSED
jgi:hypothetical protein